MKKILFLLLFPLGLLAQSTDTQIKANSNNLIRNATTVTRANHALINDQLTDTKSSRIEVITISGTNTYTASINWLSAYTSGLNFLAKFSNSNTTSATLNINSLGAIAFKKYVSGVVTNLSSGDIVAGQVYTIAYDGTYFQLTGGSGGASSFATLSDGFSLSGNGLSFVRVNSGGTSLEPRTPSQVQSDISAVTTSRTITTNSPLSGGGDLSADRTLSIQQATTSQDGYLSSTDWNTFNGKESALTFSSPLNRSVNTISIPAASSSVNGYLTSTDWTTFNNKGSGTVTSVAASGGTTGLSFSGSPITTSGTLALSGTLVVANGGTGLTSLGSALQNIRVNAGGTALEYYTPTVNPLTTTGDLIQSADNSGTPTRLASVATGNVLLSGGVATLNSWGKVTSSHIDATVQTAGLSRLLTGTNTFSGSVTDVVTSSNTFTIRADGLTNTQTDGAGILLSNTTASTIGSTLQYSPSIVMSGSAYGTLGATSQNVKFGLSPRTVSGGSATGIFAIRSSVNGSAYTDLFSVTTNGLGSIFQLNVTNTFSAGITTLNNAGLATTPAMGLNINNSSIATSGIPVQVSPMIRFTGTAWNGSLSREAPFYLGVVPINGTNPVKGNFIVSMDMNNTGTRKQHSLFNSDGGLLIGTGSAPNATLDTSGSFAAAITTITTNTTLNSTHYTVLCDATSGNITITLPTGSTVTRRVYVIKKIDATANTVTFTADGGTVTLSTQNAGRQIHYNGSSYYVISSF